MGRFRGLDSDPGWIKREHKAIWRAIRELRAGHSLESSSVEGGKVTVREILTNPGVGVEFRNTDVFTATAGEDLPCPLTFLPRDGSEDVVAGGVPQVAGVDWTRDGRILTLLTDPGYEDGYLVSVSYAYDPTDQPPPVPPAITAPASGATVGATPTIGGTGEPGYTITVAIDGTTVGSTTVAADGTWTLVTTTPLADGAHTVTATQTGPVGSESSTSSTFSSVGSSPFAPVQRGNTTTITPATSLALPPGTQAGDLLCLVLCATSSGAIASSSDARFTGSHIFTSGDSADRAAAYWGIADASGSPVSINLDSDTNWSTATLVAYAATSDLTIAQVGELVSGAAPVASGVDATIALCWTTSTGTTVRDTSDNYTLDARTTVNVALTYIGHWAGPGDSPVGTFIPATTDSGGLIISVEAV